MIPPRCRLFKMFKDIFCSIFFSLSAEFFLFAVPLITSPSGRDTNVSFFHHITLECYPKNVVEREKKIPKTSEQQQKTKTINCGFKKELASKTQMASGKPSLWLTESSKLFPLPLSSLFSRLATACSNIENSPFGKKRDSRRQLRRWHDFLFS